MNEVILVIGVVIATVATNLLVARLKRPSLNYVRIVASIGLLILIWGFGGGSGTGPRIILSALVLTTIWREYLSLRKHQAENT